MSIPLDKAFHFLGGWAAAATLWPILHGWAWVVALLAGVAKEVWDLKGHGTPEVADAVVTLAGGCVAVLVMGFLPA